MLPIDNCWRPIKNIIRVDSFHKKNIMKNDSLQRLIAWFDRYTRSFLTNEAKFDGPLTLKIDHTARVRENIRQLARNLSLDNDDLRLAEAVALFHDIGRFEQYRRYGTFNDGRSVNHAKAGIDVLTQFQVLDHLPDNEKNTIIDSVRFHNAPSLPQDNGSDAMIFMRLIRDADKLDIWKVFADYFQCAGPQDPAIVQHFLDQPTWAQEIIEDILEKRTARFKAIKSINDYKLFQLSWVFGLHFPATAVLACERGHLAAIAGTLPADDAIGRAVSTVMAELETAVR
jgi:putative nucleotidyltransferase with HDIG domain